MDAVYSIHGSYVSFRIYMMMQFKMAHASVRPKEINAQGKGEHCQFQARHLDQPLSYPQLKKNYIWMVIMGLCI